MSRTVVIDCFPSSVVRYVADHAIVAIDVIRATTVVVTAVAGGRRCLLASDVPDAFALRERFNDAILAGEVRGDMPEGFDMNNSPADLQLRQDVHRAIIVLSTSGTELMLAAARAPQGAQVACFRNFSAAARNLEGHPGPIAIIGAGSRNEFREEDQMCCAWVAEQLVKTGHRPADARTMEIIEQWSGAPAEACDTGNSVAYLQRSGQLRDRDFIVSHIDDLDMVCSIVDNEVYPGPPAGPATSLSDRRNRQSRSKLGHV